MLGFNPTASSICFARAILSRRNCESLSFVRDTNYMFTRKIKSVRKCEDKKTFKSIKSPMLVAVADFVGHLHELASSIFTKM
jgi:hypothetical protein